MRLVRIAVLLLPFVLAGILLAQPSSQVSPATLTGTVVDPSGVPLANAAVDLVRVQAIMQSTVTGADGEFTFRGVLPGVYEIRASRESLAPVSIRVAVAGVPIAPVRLVLGIPIETARAGTGAGTGQGLTVVGGVVSGRGGTGGGAYRPGNAVAAPMVASEMVAGGVMPSPAFNREAYDRIDDNPFRRVADHPVSTFSTDVDTASYANVRRFLNEGRVPPADAVRIEEFVNYFRFAYGEPRGDAPLSVTTELAPCPWSPRHRLALIGLQARKQQTEKPVRNLVFLLDVSGSMQPPDKLPLVKAAMHMLTDTLGAADRVGIVVYAGASGLALPSTPGSRKAEIHRAIDALQAGGSTNGASGIQLAYNTAASSLAKGGVNRVILATDGDFNVGITSRGDLMRLIEQERERGIFLSVLGVGTGNLQDAMMEQLADRGNGNYSYLDSLQEARRVLIEEAGSTLETVAKDVKVQVEFNPRTVGAYRLVGYENRVLAREDFNDDRKDAGELGAGHTVTMLYEIVPPGERVPGGSIDPLVYQDQPEVRGGSRSNDLMTVKIRYKKPDTETSELMSVAVANTPSRAPSSRLGFAAAVAQFGMLLRASEFKGDATYASTRSLAVSSLGDHPDDYRAEFIRLVDLAAALQTTRPIAPQQ